MPDDKQSYRVIKATLQDLDGLVRAHLEAFPGQYLALLGSGCLRSFYTFYIRRDGIVLVAVDDDGQVLGLVAGGDPRLRWQFVRAHKVQFMLTAFCKSFVHRRVLQRSLEHARTELAVLGVRLGLIKPSPAVEPPPGPWSSLLSICVSPRARGRGVGQALLEAFRQESAARKYQTMCLSVHSDNVAAIRLYEKCGWQKIHGVPGGTYFRRSVEP